MGGEVVDVPCSDYIWVCCFSEREDEATDHDGDDAVGVCEMKPFSFRLWVVEGLMDVHVCAMRPSMR